ncbi:hypothetical protein SK128_006102 [Halocaridina rubra]|uniref:Uncharacterized protein n=1 Tax=Halocaridina rubra TaxID=373956 RepID=A0AAN8WU56_HALRR
MCRSMDDPDPLSAKAEPLNEDSEASLIPDQNAVITNRSYNSPEIAAEDSNGTCQRPYLIPDVTDPSYSRPNLGHFLEAFDSKTSITSNSSQDYGENGQGTSECDEVTNHELTVDVMLNENTEKPFMCNICNKAFAKKGGLKQHSFTHSTEKQHICTVCNKGFTLKGHLKKHFLIHTGEKPFVCDICNRAFSQSGSLKLHAFTHEGIKPHACHLCPKTFTQRGELARHLMKHTGERPFVCNICNKTFTEKRLLKTHSLFHRAEKNFVCPICFSSFSQKGDLKRHSVIHTGTKPYICSVCNKGFAQRGNLSEHEKIHLKEKPVFLCEMCDKTFGRRADLRRHLRRYCKEKSCICTVCHKPFRKAGDPLGNGENKRICNSCFKNITVQEGFLRKPFMPEHYEIGCISNTEVKHENPSDEDEENGVERIIFSHDSEKDDEPERQSKGNEDGVGSDYKHNSLYGAAMFCDVKMEPDSDDEAVEAC